MTKASLCVYLGASMGTDTMYLSAAQALGEALASRAIKLVYGGAERGLMGVLASAVLAGGGEVIGVMSEDLVEEKLHPDLTTVYRVPTMAERKRTMAELSDGFLVMPGGLGTLDEMIETWVAIKIGKCNKPLGLLNLNGYFDGLFEFLHQVVQQGFLKQEYFDLVMRDTDLSRLLDALQGRLVTPTGVE